MVRRLAFLLVLATLGIASLANAISLSHEIPISTAINEQREPAVALDPVNHRFLVVWSDSRSGSGWNVYGQIVNSDGTLFGNNFSISTSRWYNGGSPDVSYDPVNRRFLVIWTEGGVPRAIYGRFVDPTGQLQGAEILISNTTVYIRRPKIAYDPGNQRFLICWDGMDPKNEGGDYINTEMFIRLINADGTFLGKEISINTANSRDPTVAYDSVNQRYFVLWSGFGTESNFYSIYGQLLNADGTLFGNKFPISATPHEHYNPIAFYDIKNQRFFVVWSSYGMQSSLDRTGINIYGKFISIDDEGTSIGHWGIGILTMSHNEILIFLSAFIFLVVFSILFILWRKRIVSR